MRELIERLEESAYNSFELLQAMWWYSNEFHKGLFEKILSRSKLISKRDYQDYKRHYKETNDDNKPMSYDEWLNYKVQDLDGWDTEIIAKKFLKAIQQGSKGSVIRKNTTFTPESIIALYKEETY
jgi:uncharacterized short protein YbdD (DUF466 family)